MIVAIDPVLVDRAATLGELVGGQGHKTPNRRGIELRLSAPNGLFGVGEASPLPKFSKETLEECRSALAAIAPFEQILPESLAHCAALIDHRRQCVPERLAAARFAIEGALVDLFGKHLQCSATEILAAMASVPFEAERELSISTLIPLSSESECLDAARRAWTRGYRVFKLKIGADPLNDGTLRLLRLLREKYGDALHLRLDPNGHWAPQQLGSILAAFEPFSPELIEEPLPLNELIAHRVSLPTGLDESLNTIDDLALALDHRDRIGLRAVVLKPALRGLRVTIELARRAKAEGLGVIVTHLFDGPVGHATAASLALLLGSTEWAHGLAPHPGLLLDPSRKILGLEHGRLTQTAVPGLPLLEFGRC
jgi:L-alanine-DL-glutamate epimerase-like enolase superfamily enzyme